MTIIDCGKADCKNNKEYRCQSERIKIRKGKCLDYNNGLQCSIRELMSVKSSNCHKRNGKYKSNNVCVVK